MRSKFFLQSALLLMALILPFSASGDTTTSDYSFTVDGLYYKKLSGGTTVSVTYKSRIEPLAQGAITYTKYATGEIVIPETVTYNDVTYTVTAIADNAFRTQNITKITIPNTVETIGQYAFYECTKLTSVNMSNSVTSIGKYAYYGCSSLTSIEIPNSVTSIGGYAFSGCSSLTSIEIPNSVTSIGFDAFQYCI